jgi:hypothetical protein
MYSMLGPAGKQLLSILLPVYETLATMDLTDARIASQVFDLKTLIEAACEEKRSESVSARLNILVRLKITEFDKSLLSAGLSEAAIKTAHKVVPTSVCGISFYPPLPASGASLPKADEEVCPDVEAVGRDVTFPTRKQPQQKQKVPRLGGAGSPLRSVMTAVAKTDTEWRCMVRTERG